MKVTADMLNRLANAIASDAVASILVLGEGHFVEVHYNKGADCHRKRIHQLQFGDSPEDARRVQASWDALVQELADTLGTGPT